MHKLLLQLLLAFGLLVLSVAGSYSCERPDLDRYYGESKECVALVKSTCSSDYDCGLCGAPQTSKWKKGIQVKGADAVVAAYTAIATFDSSSKYRGHAAIYVEQDAEGLWVYDQYQNQSVKYRMLRFGNNYHYPSNDGDAFHVIE